MTPLKEARDKFRNWLNNTWSGIGVCDVCPEAHRLYSAAFEQMTAEVESLRTKLRSAERHGHNPMLGKYCDEFMQDALVAIAGSVCTPERGYIEDGGMQLLLSDIKRLRKQHDAYKEEVTRLRALLEDRCESVNVNSEATTRLHSSDR